MIVELTSACMEEYKYYEKKWGKGHVMYVAYNQDFTKKTHIKKSSRHGLIEVVRDSYLTFAGKAIEREDDGEIKFYIFGPS